MMKAKEDRLEVSWILYLLVAGRRDPCTRDIVVAEIV